MQMIIRSRNYLVLLLFAGLVACAQVGLPNADTFNQKLAVAYSAVTQVRTTATTLLQAKKISADDAQNVNNQADHARAGLDIARAVSKTDLTAADAKLTAVHTVLTALSAYLATKGN